MAKETFSKGGASTVTFDRASQISGGDGFDTDQNLGISYGRSKKVNSYNDTPTQIKNLTFLFITLTIKENIITFFNDSNVNWRKNTFTFTDTNGNAFTVRLAQDELSIDPMSTGEKFSMNINLEVE